MSQLMLVLFVLVACLVILVMKKYTRRNTSGVKNTNRSYEAWKRSRKMRMQ